MTLDSTNATDDSQAVGVIPTDPNAAINNGESTAESRSVGIVISIVVTKEVANYYLSENYATPESSSNVWTSVGVPTKECNLTVPYNLSSGGGQKKVYLWFKNSDGVVSKSASTTIYLKDGSNVDTSAPTNQSITINNNASTTTSREVSINLSVTDNSKIISYYINETMSTPDANSYIWISVTPTSSLSKLINFVLSSGSGTKIVYVWYRDAGSNISTPAQYSITYSAGSSGGTTGSWTKLFGSSGWDCGNSITAREMIFVCGSTTGNFKIQNAGKHDLFALKYNGAGNLVGTTQEGTSSSDEANALLYEQTWGGDVYITGYCKGWIGDNTFPSTGNIFINCYEFDLGRRISSSQFGTSGSDVATCITSKTSVRGAMYLAGHTTGSFSGYTNKGEEDVFVTYFGPTGFTGLATTQFGSTDGRKDIATAIVYDNANDKIYVTGYTEGQMGDSKFAIDDIFLTKLSSNLQIEWTKQIGKTNVNCWASGIALDTSGNIYISGYAAGSLYGTSAGGDEIILIKYNSSGTRIWGVQLGSVGNDAVYGVAIDSSDNIYLTGATNGTLGDNNYGGKDIFVAKFSSVDGSNTWIKQIGTDEDDEGKAISYSSTFDCIFITGYSKGSLDGILNNGSADAFILKYDLNGIKQ